MMTIPLISTNILGPKKFERIIVPVYESLPYPRDLEDEEKPVTEKVIDIENSTPNYRLIIQKPRTFEDGKGNYRKSFNYSTNSKKPSEKLNEYSTRPKDNNSFNQPIKSAIKGPEKNNYGSPNKIQPLHIKTKVFENASPDHSKEPQEDKRKKFRDQQEKLKINNLPKNPSNVPETNWFDNHHAKYNYGIVHDLGQLEDLKSLEDADINESKETLKVKATKVALPSKIHAKVNHPETQQNHPQLHTQTHPQSNQISHSQNNPQPSHISHSQKHPIGHSKIHHENGNDGKFLYKSEVYYPTYRDHLYLPFTTYYGDANIFPKHLPVYSTHAVIHTPPPISHPKPFEPPKEPPSIKSTKPVTFQHPITHKNEPPKQINPVPPETPVPKKPEEAPSEEEEDEYEDYEEDENSESDNEQVQNDDYEEEDSSEDDDGSSKRQQQESSDEESEEVEEDEKPHYRYSSFKNRNDDESKEEDEFDRAWRKYGYGPTAASSEENESSESRLVPQKVEPEQRKKIVHMKMEYYKAPHDESSSEPTPNTMKVTKPQRKMNSKRSGSINNNETDESRKKKRKSKKIDVKSQQQHPNAGPDDLKFFQ